MGDWNWKMLFGLFDEVCFFMAENDGKKKEKRAAVRVTFDDVGN